MTKPPARGGVAGLFLLLCGASLIVGAAFDFSIDHGPTFWLADEPGGAAAVGAGAAALVIVAGWLGRIALGRRRAAPERGGGRDGSHS